MKPNVATREEWLAARLELLEEEKDVTRRSDELGRRRHALPWVPVEKEYTFESDEGAKVLASRGVPVYPLMQGQDRSTLS